MRVIDSSLWIEYLADGPLADEAEKHIEPLDTCIVPAMVVYELAKWSTRNFEPAKAADVVSILTECAVIEMDVTVAAEAARLSLLHRLHTTDAIIYATAQVNEADLFTSDAHFKGLPGVQYFSK